jgi:hypothetical protein
VNFRRRGRHELTRLINVNLAYQSASAVLDSGRQQQSQLRHGERGPEARQMPATVKGMPRRGLSSLLRALPSHGKQQ